MAVTHGEITVEWLGYATIRIEHGETTVYFDPGRYGVLTGEWEPETAAGRHHPPTANRRPQDGDIVCLTHTHHYDPDGIERVLDEDGTLVAFEGMAPQSSSRDLPRVADLPYDVVEMGSEDERAVGNVTLWTVPAYNEPDGPRTTPEGAPIHPKGRGCGYLIAVGGTRIFWPGDTDVLAGHDALDVDIFMPPISGSLTMSRAEAAELAGAMEPSLVVPIHYNTFERLEADSRAFAADVASRGIPVALDER